MSVLIKGMKMPKSCSSCSFMHDSCGEGYYCSLLKKTFDRWDEISVKRGKGCPLFEVQPHGRLIDADALKNDRADVYMDFLYDGYVEDTIWGYSDDLIDKQPTIIEAEGSKL